jgi:two-component system, NtrC family, sensor histidine kinase PilS
MSERPPAGPPRPGPGFSAISPASRLPDPGRTLGWVHLGRLGLVLALVLRAYATAPASPSLLPTALVLAAIAVAVTALSIWHTTRLQRRPERLVLHAEVIFDALLLTAVVYLTGGEASIFAPLYILVICAGALLLPMPGGILVGLLAGTLFFATAVWGAEGGFSSVVLLQVSLFAVVAVVAGFLADRLRRAGTALGLMESELRQLRLDTGDILNTVSTGVLTVDGAGRLVYLNPAAEEILALPAAEWTGRPILAELDRIASGLGSALERSAATRTPVRRFETTPAAEDDRILGLSTTLVEREGEANPAVTAIFQDITEKMRVEALRRRAERLEAVAELSASLAHEIKNPLASIRSAVEQIAGGGVDPEDARILRALVVRESDRLSRLLAEFIDFARVKVTEPRPVDLGPLVEQVALLVRAHPDAADRTVRVTDHVGPGRGWIRGAEDLLHRAVFNLALNAVQWAGPGGRVELTLDEVRSDLLSPALGALGLVRVTVADTGPGVPDEIVEQIFDPFFTRRPGGAGLGLALVQRAVEAHGGAVFVDTAPAGSGLGATFTLYLPALPAPERAAIAPHPIEETVPL